MPLSSPPPAQWPLPCCLLNRSPSRYFLLLLPSTHRSLLINYKKLCRTAGVHTSQIVSPLTPQQEQTITTAIKDTWGITAVASLQNERLNRSYGLIGAEQHLPRFPGDSLDQHDEPRQEGITPGLGAWGYFAPSKEQLTQDLIEREKWYVAVQTLYLPDWNTRFRYLRDWYQYRKVLVVNPVNGKTVAADVADAGPADWTGKHFGGSPEVMAYLGLNVGMQKGPVILFLSTKRRTRAPWDPYCIMEINNNMAKIFTTI